MWQEIKDFPNCFVNELGEVKGVSGKILRPIYDKDGYTKVSLRHVTGKIFSKRIHRIVASCFIPNPENKPVVNHLNGIKDDNRLENLEWATISENGSHAYREGLVEHPQNKPVIVTLDGDVVGEFKNSQQAQKSLKINRKTMIDYREGGKLLYGELRLMEVDFIDKDSPYYNIEIIKESDGSVLNAKPIKCSNGKIYKSIEATAKDLGINYKTVSKYMHLKEPYNDLHFIQTTPYEYLKSIGVAL